MKKDFGKFKPSIEKLDLITGGVANQTSATIANDSGHTTENCKGTVEMSTWITTDADEDRFGDWYSDC